MPKFTTLFFFSSAVWPEYTLSYSLIQNVNCAVYVTKKKDQGPILFAEGSNWIRHIACYDFGALVASDIRFILWASV